MVGEIIRKIYTARPLGRIRGLLPARGTGLLTRTAGPRRGGQPRTYTQRLARHSGNNPNSEKARLRRYLARLKAEETKRRAVEQLDYDAIKLGGSHTLGSQELRTGNHTQPGRMGHTRPEPSVSPRSRHPEAVNHVIWQFKPAAHVAPKSLSKGSVVEHEYGANQPGQGLKDGLHNKSPSKTN